MKIVIMIFSVIISFSVLGIDGIVGESVENYVSSCGYRPADPWPECIWTETCGDADLTYCHEQVDRMLDEWEDQGGYIQYFFKDYFAWSTDLQDPDLCTGTDCGTDLYTDDKAQIVVFSGHGGLDGFYQSDKIWSSTSMCPHNGYVNAQGRYIQFENKGEHLVLFTCFSVHDFKTNNGDDYVPDYWQTLRTWREWDYPFRKNFKNEDDENKPMGKLNMVYGFAGLSTDSADTDENGEDFIEDIKIQSQKQAWFTGNEDTGLGMLWSPDIDDTAGVITWGGYGHVYDNNSGIDAIKRRDNHKIIEKSEKHIGDVALAWSHHDC